MGWTPALVASVMFQAVPRQDNPKSSWKKQQKKMYAGVHVRMFVMFTPIPNLDRTYVDVYSTVRVRCVPGIDQTDFGLMFRYL